MVTMILPDRRSLMSTCPPFSQTPTYAKASSIPRHANFLKSLGGALLNIKSYIKEF